MTAAADLVDEALGRCTFPPAGTPLTCGLSGGPDSAALVALAHRAGVSVTAVHVHHGLRSAADDDAAAAARIAERVGVAFRCERVDLDDGPDLEARARTARRRVLGPDHATGHTADDQAETVLLALLRGSGARGLGGMRTGTRHPILALRRAETHEICRVLGLEPIDDPSNNEPRFRRNRVRHEAIPLLDDIARRDTTPLIDRAARLLRDDDDLLEELAASIDPTDARALAAAAVPLARRAIRRWLELDGHPPDSASVDRVLEVASGSAEACEVNGGRRVQRSSQRLSLHFPPRS